MSHTNPDPTFSVVIPCFNEEKYLGKLLANLQNQTEKPARVVVADCSSDDATVAVAKSFTGKLSLKIVEGCERSPAAARNAGTGLLKDLRDHDYVVFIDADQQIPNTFFEQLCTIIEAHPVDMITPRFTSDGRSALDKLAVRSINQQNRRTIEHQHKAAGIGGVMVVRKGAHDKTGGFPEDVKQDDLGYIARLNAIGATAYYAGDISVLNSSRRWQRDSLFRVMYDYIPEQSPAARLIARVVKKKRQYGHYNT